MIGVLNREEVSLTLVNSELVLRCRGLLITKRRLRNDSSIAIDTKVIHV
jgi:hypothetical protein